MAYSLVRVINYYTNSVIIKLTDYSVLGGILSLLASLRLLGPFVCVCVCALVLLQIVALVVIQGHSDNLLTASPI